VSLTWRGGVYLLARKQSHDDGPTQITVVFNEAPSPSDPPATILFGQVLPRQSVGGVKLIQKCVRTRYPLLSTTVLREKLTFGDPFLNTGVVARESVILLLNDQRQIRTLHARKDVLPYALC
jgi:hypothetical protein